ncbi:type II secretion system minor pseudopilin GspJ [Microbulbifer sp. ZKSA006]|uniref:type II secretion system minor pseudopilin GspJ n=1 Tax=Microbulbifer sp. ZKSA006 TaxID=3243390 RepID=UPI004039FB05
MSTRLPTQSGFTLVEVLIVLVLVAIISVGSFSLLGLFFDTEEMVDQRAEQLRRFSMAMYRIDNDFRQVTARAIKNAYSGYEPALRGDEDELEFTRLGAANLTGEPRGELLRLSYAIGYTEDLESDSLVSNTGEDEDIGGLLLRSRWQILDRSPDSESIAEPLLTGVESLSFQYLDPDSDAWVAQWPPVSSTTSTTSADTRLPEAIELVLVTRQYGEIRRVFQLPVEEGSSSDDNGDDDDDT